MSVRITKASDSGMTVLHVAGRLRSEDVDALNGEFQGVDGPVALELSELQSADPAGIAALSKIGSLGAEMRGASTYIQLLLARNSQPPE